MNETLTIEKVEKKIATLSNSLSLYRDSENLIVGDTHLDLINDFRANILKLNNGIVKLIDSLDSLYELSEVIEREKPLLIKLLKELENLQNELSTTFTIISKNKLLEKGCKTPLLDLKINIGNIVESIKDLKAIVIDKTHLLNRKINSISSNF